MFSTYYFHYDRLGSVVELTDSSKTEKNSYRYYAFGSILTSTENVTNTYKFTGEEYDSNPGLVYLRARYYDPSIGRFISRDPLLEQVYLAGGPGCVGCGSQEKGLGTLYYWPQMLHPYGYCGNNPVNEVDPEGEYLGILTVVGGYLVYVAFNYYHGYIIAEVVIAGIGTILLIFDNWDIYRLIEKIKNKVRPIIEKYKKRLEEPIPKEKRDSCD